MKSATVQCLALVLNLASAHTIMQAVGVGSTVNTQGVGIYMPSNDSYISDVTSNSIACNGPPVTYFTSSSTVIAVTAGDTVTGSWLHTLTSTGPDSEADNKVIDSSHKGPVQAYMKKVTDATQNPSAGPGDGWFKVAEAGLISSTEWAVDALISAGGVQNVTIPNCIENGNYLLRFEIIALHSAYDIGGAQFYLECAQINVSGGSGTSTPPTVALPGTYSAADPGIDVNIYNAQGSPYPSSYVIPGPTVFTCGADSGAAATVGSSSAIAMVSAAVGSSSMPTMASAAVNTSMATTFVTSASPGSATVETSTPESTEGCMAHHWHGTMAHHWHGTMAHH